jgi:hypothetical protein
MSLPSYKNGDAVYTVIYRSEEAKQRLSKWTSTSRSIQARVEENKMYIFDHNTLSLFIVTWTHSWDNILVWDTFNKRHIYF